MGLTEKELRTLLENADSPFIRCVGFLFIRYGMAHMEAVNWLEEYLLDDEEFKPSLEAEWTTTIGEFVEGLLSSDKPHGLLLPRFPHSMKRIVEERLAPLGQYRKRTLANKAIIDTYRERNVKVEAMSNGDWLDGRIIELDDSIPSRIKVRIQLEDRSEESIHIGMVILADQRNRGRSPGRRGRSRSRDRGGIDWTRDKGESLETLVEAMRAAERDKAVCTSGKDYARKPVGYKAACALAREQGKASHRLMEEETFVRQSKPTRLPSPERVDMGKMRAPTQEEIAQKQKIFEKYVLQNTASGSASRSNSEVEGPDTLRFG